ncbi:12276_t:CDS:2, partial [Dentiscutata heterogama]
PMSIENWLNPKGEHEVHQQFTDEDFVQKKLAVLCNVLKIVTEIVDDGNAILKSLRKIQSYLREEI